ncbi:uncharacterized protein BJ171DRAFT_500600 [Polychytrium aggregatum]|uniref:uncharacterized protein n=1 Tax=Polychytrium aggregatum TaxID=110093 RepID=UPI0022FE674C|nr:uncharacterized protein BJ171DRAFT_500600 [Polychytrium aggregatum]KAI9205482.1 hypothetical protein BJ171DRAFT_500600 [Polychytrium aggregatum]
MGEQAETTAYARLTGGESFPVGDDQDLEDGEIIETAGLDTTTNTTTNTIAHDPQDPSLFWHAQYGLDHSGQYHGSYDPLYTHSMPASDRYEGSGEIGGPSSYEPQSNAEMKLVVISSEVLKPGSVVLVDGSGLTIGRDRAPEKRLQLKEMAVSRFHAMIFVQTVFEEATSQAEIAWPETGSAECQTGQLPGSDPLEAGLLGGFIGPIAQKPSDGDSLHRCYSADVATLEINEAQVAISAAQGSFGADCHGVEQKPSPENGLDDRLQTEGGLPASAEAESGEEGEYQEKDKSINNRTDDEDAAQSPRNESGQSMDKQQSGESDPQTQAGTTEDEQQRIYITRDCFFVVDQGSVHGTMHNGWRLSEAKKCSQPQALRHEDTITIGSTTFQAHIHEAWSCEACRITDDNEIVTDSTAIAQAKKTKAPAASKHKSLESRRRDELNRLRQKYRFADKDTSTNPQSVDRAQKRRERDGPDTPDSFSPKRPDHKPSPAAAEAASHSPGQLKFSKMQMRLGRGSSFIAGGGRGRSAVASVFSEETSDQDTRPAAPKPLMDDETNVGNQLLRKMGWTTGTGLGKEGDGRHEPIAVTIKSERSGLGFKST